MSVFVYVSCSNKMNRDTAFPTRLHARPVETHISLRTHAVCSEYSQGTVDSQGSKASSGGRRRVWSDCADAQADLSLR